MNAIERLKLLIALGEKAARGEWTHHKTSCRNDPMSERRWVEAGTPESLVEAWSEDNERFIVASANARPDFAKLLAVVEAARERDAARRALDSCDRDYTDELEAAGKALRAAERTLSAALAALEATE